jgi:rRNA maturation RNase YbeY
VQIKRLNKLYRNKDKPTDVLSFPIGEKVEDWLILGDIVISVDTAKRQAQELGPQFGGRDKKTFGARLGASFGLRP